MSDRGKLARTGITFFEGLGKGANCGFHITLERPFLASSVFANEPTPSCYKIVIRKITITKAVADDRSTHDLVTFRENFRFLTDSTSSPC